jgi:hypothetical protein
VVVVVEVKMQPSLLQEQEQGKGARAEEFRLLLAQERRVVVGRVESGLPEATCLPRLPMVMCRMFKGLL